MLTSGVLIAGRYRVERKLGEGAMGSVWLAKNVVTEREFAIKVLLPQAASAPAAFERFFREAKICGSIRHPSILEIYDADTAPELNEIPYLVMELLDGAPLDVVLAERGTLPPRFALDIVAQLARGLHLAHQKGIVHRDLKPANVFLHRPGTGAVVPKVLDFGISKIVSGPTSDVKLTQTAAILGSPLYMSPEQMDTGKPIDARSDVHALGLLLWECLVGRPPFSASSYNALICEIMIGPRPKLSDSAPALSPHLGALAERAFAIAPDDRFPSAAALADALEAELAALGGGVLSARDAAHRLLGGLPLLSRPPPPLHGSTNRPLSIDPPPAAPGRAAPLPLAPTQLSPSGSVAPSGSSPTVAASKAAETAQERQGRGAAIFVAAAGLAAIAAVGVALSLGSRGASSSPRPGESLEAAGGQALAVPEATPDAPDAHPTIAAAPEAHAAASRASGSATPSAATPTSARPDLAALAGPASTVAPAAPTKKAPPRREVTPAMTPRVPRIDESGL